VTNLDHRAGLFPALLKHWRGQRGLSQLDLALAADVSSRHLSFLETGRSSPSEAMVRRLANALGVPLRHTNAMLEAAGHRALFDQTAPTLPAVVSQALSLLKAHQEPYPLLVVDRAYRLRDLNRGAQTLLAAVVPELRSRGALDAGALERLDLNLARLTFDPHGAAPAIANFDEIGRALLWRIQRELLTDPDDGELRALLDELLAMPTVAPHWRDVDLSVPSEPVLVVRLRHGDDELRFVTMVTAFQAPQSVAVEELRVEMWFPSDDATAARFRALGAATA